MTLYRVLIISKRTKVVVKELGPFSHSKALKVEAGININLDTANYYTEIKQD